MDAIQCEHSLETLLLFQLTITSSQMQWTSDCTKALASTKERGDKKALKSLKKKQARDAAYDL